VAAITTFTVHYEAEGFASVLYIEADTYKAAWQKARLLIPKGATLRGVVRGRPPR
jgi:hypothetical protein